MGDRLYKSIVADLQGHASAKDAPFTFQFSEAGFLFLGKTLKHEVHWSHFEEVEPTDEALILWRGPELRYYVARRCFVSPDEFSQALRLASGGIGRTRARASLGFRHRRQERPPVCATVGSAAITNAITAMTGKIVTRLPWRPPA